jgi:hypothetical protein
MADPGAFDNVLKTLERNIKLLDFQLKSINTNRENIAAAEERMVCLSARGGAFAFCWVFSLVQNAIRCDRAYHI